jgi:membrane-bound serine protease (ClpP class)
VPGRSVRRAVAPRLVLAAFVAVLGAALLTESPAGAQTGAPRILVTEVRGPISPVTADHVQEGVDRVRTEGFDAYLVEMDTPGGLDTSMRDIVQSFMASDAPVIVYVAPDGARAASAGAIITLASHVAAMAPGTTIGAATPVDLQGGEITDKIINDAVSYVQAIAETRGRDEQFAEDIVREGRSVTSSEALEVGAVDLLAPNRDALLQRIDGQAVDLRPDTQVTLRTAGAELVTQEIGIGRRLLQWLADPNVAFLFLSLGTLAILYEIANPGVGLGGIAGVIMLLLAFVALAILPVTAAGVLLLILAAGLFVAELFVPGVGVFAVGGTIALILSGAFLFRGPIAVDPVVLLPTALVAGGGAILAGRLVWRTRRLPGAAGSAAIVGKRGTVQTADGRFGQAMVAGSYWSVRANAPLKEGQRVRVVDMEGLELIVEPEEENVWT